MTTPNSTNRGKRLIVALAGVGIVLGLSIAGFLSTLVNAGNAAATPTQTIDVVPSTTPTPDQTSSAAPAPAPTNGTITQVGPTVITTTTGKPYKGTQTLTNTSTKVTVTPKPTKPSTPKPTATTPSTTAKACPMTRSDNPSVWDACRAGYIAPTIEFGGIISCQAIDRDKGIWKVVRKYTMVGGQYRSAEWAGLSNNAAGTSTLTIRGLPASALGQPQMIPLNASIYVGSMNGLPGDIDTVERSWDVDVVLSGVCS